LVEGQTSFELTVTNALGDDGGVHDTLVATGIALVEVGACSVLAQPAIRIARMKRTKTATKIARRRMSVLLIRISLRAIALYGEDANDTMEKLHHVRPGWGL